MFSNYQAESDHLGKIYNFIWHFGPYHWQFLLAIVLTREPPTACVNNVYQLEPQVMIGGNN